MELLKLSKLCKTGAEHKPITDLESGEVCCAICGVVISDATVVSRSDYGRDGFKIIQHSPVHYSMGDKALGSMISKEGPSGRKLNYTNKFIRIGDRQAKGLIEFRKVSDKLNLPEHVIEEATKCFIYIRKKGFLRGREINSIVGACVYLFSKKNGLNLTMKEICNKLSINSKMLFSHYSDLVKVLEIEYSDMKPSLPIDYVEQICSNFKIDIKIKMKCTALVKEMQESSFHVGKNPTAVAAGGIYMACEENRYLISQTALSIISGISAVSIRNITKGYRAMKK